MSCLIYSRSFFEAYQKLLDFVDGLPETFLTLDELSRVIFNLDRGTLFAAELKILFPIGSQVTADLHARLNIVVNHIDKARAIVLKVE